MQALDYAIRIKPVTVTSKLPTVPQGRDTFETPNYAVDLLIPYIPKNITYIWEPAAGNGKITKRLGDHKYGVYSTDIRPNPEIIDTLWNFVDNRNFPDLTFFPLYKYAIITNPPFSIKEQFINRAFEYGVPFAFLINADYSGQQIDWIERGCQKIIPKRRIDFITPNVLQRIHEGELFKNEFKKIHPQYKKIKDIPKKEWTSYLDSHEDYYRYEYFEEVPQEIKIKYTSSQFHTMWLTYGFDLGKTETFVDLKIEDKKNNI